MEIIEDEELIKEEEFLDYVDDDFSKQIKERGKSYYENSSIIKCLKSGNNYYGKVWGSANEPYKVEIYNTEDGLDYTCTCPCDYPCKHEYAVFLAISNQEYETIELKKEIKEHKNNLQSIIEKIPAEKIKQYLLSPEGSNHVCFEMKSFEDYFRDYLPKQSYEFYYNNLFNSLVLENDNVKLITSYMNRIKQYISSLEFMEVYKIIKSIIEAYNDTNRLNCDNYIIDIFPSLGMFLRVLYRKSDSKLKIEINKWIKKIEEKNYYNNVYLEDILITLK